MDISVFSASGAKIAAGDCKGAFAIGPAVLKKAGGKFSAKMSVPIRDMAGYFDADTTDGPVPRLDWTISFDGYSSRNYPLLCFFSQSGANCCTLFFDNLVDDFTCVAQMNQQNCTYDITWTFAVTDAKSTVTCYADTRAGHWTQAISRAMKTLRPQGLPRFPEGAWKPVYCTWYAAHAWLTNEFLDENARLAAELGCGTFIVDDGWCYDEKKRVSPQTIGTWYDDIGDWELSDRKLPGFKAHVAYAQSLGLKYLLWVAPYFCFKNSKFYKSLGKDDRDIASAWGTFIFNLEKKDISGQVIARMEKLVRDLGLDGLKVDFLDVAQGSVDKPVGRYSLDFIKKLSATIRKCAGDNALIEFRQRYATPQMLDYGTQFRAGDVPFDYLRNIAKLAAIRVVAGDKVPVHADPLYWRQDELDVIVARHMIASLSAVPMISMDLAQLAKPHKAIVSHYLGFYLDHLATFSKGRWQVRFGGALPTYLSVTRGGERIVILVDECHLGEATAGFNGTVHVLNMSAAQVKAAQGFDLRGHPAKKGVIAPGGRGIL